MHNRFEIHIWDCLVGIVTIKWAGTSKLPMAYNCGSFMAMGIAFY